MYELTGDKISKQYKKKLAVDDVSFCFSKGVYGLLGANGAGKTTLLRMIAGLLSPSAGEIRLNGSEIRKLDGEYRRHLGYLPQDFGYYPNYTAERYLRYLAQLKAAPPSLLEERLKELLTLTGLWEFRKDKMKTFSGGMIRRLGIAQALLNDPDILILDEPTAGLDPKERIRFRNLLSSLGRNRIVILSTHIVSDVEYIADEILLMKAGRVIRQGMLSDILKCVEGKVWEAEVAPNEAEAMNQAYLVGNIRNVENKISLRIVSEEKPSPHAANLEPLLEDVYLYYFGAEGGEGK